MAQYYQLVHSGTPVTLDDLQMLQNGHIQYIINQDETGAVHYHGNQQVIGIDEQTGATVQLGSYPQQEQIVVEENPQQGVYVIETIDSSAQTAIEIPHSPPPQQPPLPAPPQPQQPQQHILANQQQPEQFVVHQTIEQPQEQTFFSRPSANNGIIVETAVPQQVAAVSTAAARGRIAAYPGPKQLQQPQQVTQVHQPVHQPTQQQQHVLTPPQSIIQLADGQKVPLAEWRRMQNELQKTNVVTKALEPANVLTIVRPPARSRPSVVRPPIPQLPATRQPTTPRQPPTPRMPASPRMPATLQMISSPRVTAPRLTTPRLTTPRPPNPQLSPTRPVTPRQPARQRRPSKPRQNRQNNRRNNTVLMDETMFNAIMHQRQLQDQHLRIQQENMQQQQQIHKEPTQQMLNQQQQQQLQQQFQQQQEQFQRQQRELIQQQQVLSLQHPQQQQQVQHQQTHVLAPAQQRPMQVRPEYTGPRRVSSPTKPRMRSHHTLVTNNTVQAIASPTMGGNQQNILQQHDSSDVISMGEQVNSAMIPGALSDEQATAVKLDGVNTAQVLFLLPNGQPRLLKLQTPDMCIKTLAQNPEHVMLHLGTQQAQELTVSEETDLSCVPNQTVMVQTNEEVVVKQEPVEMDEPQANTILVTGNVLTTPVTLPIQLEIPQIVKSEELLDQKPDAKEQPKYVDGMLAICQRCGYTSLDFNRCQRCKRKLPENVRSIPASVETAKRKGTTMVSKEKFYSKLPLKVETSEVIKGGKRCAASKKKRKVVEEPVILTLSSDEDENDRQSDLDSSAMTERSYMRSEFSGFPGDPAVTSSAMDKEPKIPEEEDGSDTGEGRHSQGVRGGGRELDLEAIVDGSAPGLYTLLQCRTVRIGSYKVVPRDRVILSTIGMKLSVPSIEDENINVTITIDIEEVVKVLIHFGRGMPVVFVYITSSAAARIRRLLRMESKLGPYFDPASSDDTQRRITFLPEKISDDCKHSLKSIFGSLNILAELSNKEANDILVRASPKEVQNIMKKAIGIPPAKNEIQTIMVYPPPPAKGGIPINTEDYACLGEDQFLNDVIIDFYLKYLTLSVLSEEDQARTHVFSSFFYKRLTTRPAKNSRRAHPVEDDPKLSAAEKRHSRVKGWTKNVNLFEKDFVIIPINEHCHWFLAIICFPGMTSCVRISDNFPVVKPAKSPKRVTPKKVAEADLLGKPIRIGSTTITPLKIQTDTITLECGEEGSDRDEAEGEDEDMDASSDDEDNNVLPPQAQSPPKHELFTDFPQDQSPKSDFKAKTIKHREPVRQPCILIFDSLAGASRTRVVATLRDYLRIEYKVKEGKERDFSKNTIKGASPKVPQQTNFTDCGLYLLQYVESFFKDPIQDYNLPMKILAEWFPEDVVNRKREEIQKLLLDLMEKNNVDIESLNLPKLTFSSSQGDQPSADLSTGVKEESSPNETVQGGLEFTSTEKHEEENSQTLLNNGVKCGSDIERRTLVSYSDSDSNSESTPTEMESAVTTSPADDKKTSTMSYLKAKRIDRHSIREQDKAVKKVRFDEPIPRSSCS